MYPAGPFFSLARRRRFRQDGARCSGGRSRSGGSRRAHEFDRDTWLIRGHRCPAAVIPVTPVPSVFGRNGPRTHVYDAPLGQCSSDARVEVRIAARNVMHDHRVSERRVRHVDTIAGYPRTAPALRQGLVDYFRKRVQTVADPDFVDDDLNGHNIVWGAGRRIVHPDRPVARILDLSGLALVFQWARTHKIGGRRFARLPKNPGDAALAAWLDGELAGRSADDRGRFVADTLAALGAYAAMHPFQPAWIVPWDMIAPHLGAGADRWLELTGMSRPTSPRWLIVLRYPMSEGGTVARPTILDAGGWNAYHFPSPPQALLGDGGHPMELRVPLPDPLAPLNSEYIHQEIVHTLAQWEAAGSLCQATTSPTVAALEAQGIQHHQRLLGKHGAEVGTWMPSPV